MRAVRWLALLVLMAGSVLSARAVYMHAKAELAEVLIGRAWERSIASGGTPQRPWPWADTYPIGRLKIPRIGFDEFVLEGATPRTLAFGPARMQNGARFGEAGNVLLAGHRTSWFKPLQRVAAGDRLELEWYDRRNRRLQKESYSVIEIRVVNPEDVSLLQPTAESALTLVTCYPFGRGASSPQRFVVRAEESTQSPRVSKLLEH